MTKGLAALSSRLLLIEQEVSNLRQGYAVVSARYIAALNSLKSFTVHAMEAAKRASLAAQRAAETARRACETTQGAIDKSIGFAAAASVVTAQFAAEAAAEAAAAATAAASAAAAAAAHQAEESSRQASPRKRRPKR